MSQFDDMRDKAQDFAEENPDKVEQFSEQAGDKANEATGNKYADQVEQGQDTLADQFGGGDQETEGQQAGDQQAGDQQGEGQEAGDQQGEGDQQ